MISVVLGGQIGSEGKGKIAAHIASEYQMSVRTGGPNAGHTVIKDGHKYILRLIPCAFVNKNCVLAMAAGSLINKEVLLQEIENLEINPDRLIIDPQAGIIEDRHIASEQLLLKNKLSTGSGVGYATSEKALRNDAFKLARDIEELSPYIKNVSSLVNKCIDEGGHVLVEGTQGFDLSVHHGSYPFVTSRDTTSATFCGEVGASPRLVKDIILVVRTYPIRSSNGPLYEEISWDEVTRLAQSSVNIKEFTSVTKKVRRVGKFDEELVGRAIQINRPTQLALNFVDYINSIDFQVKSYSQLSTESKKFIEELERKFGVPVTLLGTGPNQEDIIDLRAEKLDRVNREQGYSYIS
ncbi:Adenylosuccinate synthetase [compost metagenome]